jgi:hypothetical protein
MEKGADVNVLGHFGLTPLNAAAIGGFGSDSYWLGNPNESVLRYVVDERADISLSYKIQALESNRILISTILAKSIHIDPCMLRIFDQSNFFFQFKWMDQIRLNLQSRRLFKCII